MLSRISIDIVEMIIVSSDDFVLFNYMQNVVFKLQDDKRVSRINDKLTKVQITDVEIRYQLNGFDHREYNKPFYVNKALHPIGCMYSYRKYRLLKRDNAHPIIYKTYREYIPHTKPQHHLFITNTDIFCFLLSQITKLST